MTHQTPSPAKQRKSDPHRCPCCGVSLTDGTDDAKARLKAVRGWFLRLMFVLIVAGVILVVAMVLDLIWGLRFVKDTLAPFALGLACAALPPLRDHWKARQSAHPLP